MLASPYNFSYWVSIVTSVLNKPFLLGPGMQWFQRAGTRVPAPMGDNSWNYKYLHIYRLKTYRNNGMQPFALFLVDHGFAFKTILHGRKVK